MATSNHTENYNLSQYAAGDPVKFLTNYNQDMAAIDAAVKAAQDSADAKTPLTRTIADLPLSADITLAQLIAAGLASGTNGDANNALKLAGVDATAIIDGEGNALNALKLGGVDAINFPQISSGTWTPTLYGATTAGDLTYATRSGVYFKINTLVITIFTIQNLALDSTISGMLRIGGLPFVPSGYGGGSIGYFSPEVSTTTIKTAKINIDANFAPNSFEIIKDLGTRLYASDVGSGNTIGIFGAVVIYHV